MSPPANQIFRFPQCCCVLWSALVFGILISSDRPGLPDPQCSGSHRSLVQRGHFRAHLLQNRRRQRGVALRLRDFLPGGIHPA